MMSGQMIAQMSRQAAARASREKKYPFIVEAEDLSAWTNRVTSFPFPNIGDWRPRGYKLVDHFMVDKTGWGADNEPALTIPQLLKRLTVGMAYAIIEEGQFQIVLGEFKPKNSV
jgi:hypothetical protein